MLCFPLAFFFGTLGLRYDQRRILALICTLIAGGLICLWLALMGLRVLCL